MTAINFVVEHTVATVIFEYTPQQGLEDSVKCKFYENFMSTTPNVMQKN